MNGNLTIDEILDTRNVAADEFLNSVEEFEKEQITKTLIGFEKSPGSKFETYKTYDQDNGVSLNTVAPLCIDMARCEKCGAGMCNYDNGHGFNIPICPSCGYDPTDENLLESI